MARLELLSETLPLAQPSAWRSLGTRFSGDYLQWRQEDMIGVLLLLGVLVGGFWLLHWLGQWQAKQSTNHSPKRLAKELAIAHRLSHRERRLCHEVARERGMEDPAELFVRVDARESISKRDVALAKRLFDVA